MQAAEFIERWTKSGGAELANSQAFIVELCDLLGVDHPDPTIDSGEDQNTYVFEKAIKFNNGDGTFSDGRVDLYKQGSFVFESKQGVEKKNASADERLATVTRNARQRSGTGKRGSREWEKSMFRARGQAKRYAEALPEWPPFLVVADIGYCFDLYADFSGTGKNYQPFPDPRSYRIEITRLSDENVRGDLRLLFTGPHQLDPSKRSAEVTREIATRLAKLAKSLEAQHDPEVVAGFLMRCLFTMFAEDVDLIKRDGFTELLLSLRTEPDNFVPMVEGLWTAMDCGEFSQFLREKVRRFNGKFFKDKTALPVTLDQLQLLIEAAGDYDWKDVEPAIFGTLLERALDPVERHKLGAHYTPRAYVERLVMPTIIEPLREQWDATYAAATRLDDEGKRKDAVNLLREFHGELCEVRVLDPACGSGNFLYVAMELMKRLEGEVVATLASFGDNVLPGITIDPHQFLGIEINPRAAALAELVLWIGYVQWHKRTRTETTPPEPILRDYGNIECRDAVLDWDRIEPVVDDDGNPVTRWDGRTTKPHPVTGEEVPDEDARVHEQRYINSRKAAWPETDYIVGNPPFIGTSRMRDALGDGYTKVIRSTYSELPESCDYVMYWWHTAAERVRAEQANRFGLITTNSLRQTFNRRVVTPHLQAKNPLSIDFAIPDHPWVDTAMCAAVRIAMTVGVPGESAGVLNRVASEEERGEEAAAIEFKTSSGIIQADLRIGADVGSAITLQANEDLSNRGYCLFGQGFVLEAKIAADLIAKGCGATIHPYLNGRDVTQQARGVFVIDVCELKSEDVRQRFPAVYQHLLDFVKPERDQNNRKSRRDNWWVYGEPNPKLRKQLVGLHRYIATAETSKHRFFVLLDDAIHPDNALIAFAVDDVSIHGVLSSKIHVCWALAAGGRLGVGNDPRYNKTRCFETFPFPITDAASKKRIGDLAEQLDAHRKRQQDQHATLTMTGMYNVLEKLRSGETLTAKDQTIHQQGLVSVLKQIHDDLDAAVFDAYGWPHDLEDEEILQRLVDLNHERAEEESRGIVRWLRPDFQNPDGATQTAFSGQEKKIPAKKAATKVKKQPWPATLPERVKVVRDSLLELRTPISSDDMAKRFTRAAKTNVNQILDTLVELGQARLTDDSQYVR